MKDSALKASCLVLLVSFIFLLPSLFASVGGIYAAPGNPRQIAFCPTNNVCSSNWSGYAVIAGTGQVTQADGSWIVPSVSCSHRGSSYAAFWVGIDGYNDNTVEQTGILAQCSNGRASYSAWYEFYPAAMVTISSLKVSPAQVVSASVTFDATTQTFVATINEAGQTYSTSPTQVSGAQESSAEWIVERPATCLIQCSLTKLANYGTGYFGEQYTSAANTNYATVGGTSSPIGSLNYVAITMVNNNGATLSQPSSLSDSGTSFTMTFH